MVPIDRRSYVTVWEVLSPTACPLTFGFKPISLFGSSVLTIFLSTFHRLILPLSLVPRQRMLPAHLLPSRVSFPGYIVGELRTGLHRPIAPHYP